MKQEEQWRKWIKVRENPAESMLESGNEAGRKEERNDQELERTDAEANGHGSEGWSGGPSRLFLFLRISVVVHRGSSKREEKRKRETTRLEDEVLAACGIIKIQPCTNCWPACCRCCCSFLLLYIHFLPPLDLLNPLLLVLLHLFSASSMSSVRTVWWLVLRSACVYIGAASLPSDSLEMF